MPMFNVPLPIDGINSDADPSAIKPTESPLLANVLLHHGPDQLSRRGPYKLDYVDSGVDEGFLPVGIAVHGSKSLTTWLDINGNESMWRPHYMVNTNFPATTRTIKARHHNGTGTLAAVGDSGYGEDDSTVGGEDARPLMPMQKPCYYEDTCYFPSHEAFTGAVKQGDAVVTATGARLVQWAGANKAAVQPTATITEGSKTIIFGSSPDIEVGMFVTFDDDDGTAYPYAYKIVSGSGTTWVLEKPYGLGDPVGNRSADNCFVRSRNIQIESPAGIAVACTHLDRLFTGRAYLPASVGTVSAGTYDNAIKWCAPFNPEKWPDENLAFVGSETTDYITGLASLGRYLIIFKRTSTWVMSGDSEANFTIRKLLGNLGCIDTRGLVEINEAIIFPSLRGIFRLNSSLELDEITSDKDGHGVRTAYIDSISWGGGAVGGTSGAALSVSATVDANNYLHVQAVGTHSLNGLSLYGLHSYSDFPMTCYLPNKAWVKFQNLKTSVGLSQTRAANPRLYSPYFYRSSPYALGLKTGILLDRLTSSSGTSFFTGVTSAQSLFTTDNGKDEVASTSASAEILLYGPDVMFENIEPFKNQTARFRKFYLHHGIVYYNASVQTTYSLTNVVASVDGATPLLPITTLGTVLGRAVGTPFTARFVTEITPSSAQNDSVHGQFLKLRLYDPCDNTNVPHQWRIHRVMIDAETARPGRVSDHLV